MPLESGEREVSIELDGPGVAPESVDPVALLEIAAAFLDVVRRLADEEGVPLPLRGVRVVDKCVAVVTETDAPERAKHLTQRAMTVLSSPSPRRGFGLATDRLERAIQQLPEGQSARVLVGRGWSVPIGVGRAAVPELLPETTRMRAVPLRVGGSNPAVRFSSPSEGEQFTLDTTDDLARSIGPHLYLEVEIEARVKRGADGKIDGGSLVSFVPVHRDASDAWPKWYRDAGGDEWDKIEDVEGELGRGTGKR